MSPRKLNETTRRVISFPDKYAAFRHHVSLYQFLPGLTGLWTASHLDPTGDWYDWTKNDLTLTAQGTPGLNYDGLATYVTFDGANDYFSRADEAATSITGAETHIDGAINGLTCGGWVYNTSATAEGVVLSKWLAAANLSYILSLRGDVAGDPLYFQISDDGANADEVASSGGYTASRWHFVAGRFNDNDTGEELACWLDGVKTTDTTARATIFDGTANFCLGAGSTGGGKLTGRLPIAFLCAAALSDDMIGALFQQSRALYGV